MQTIQNAGLSLSIKIQGPIENFCNSGKLLNQKSLVLFLIDRWLAKKSENTAIE